MKKFRLQGLHDFGSYQPLVQAFGCSFSSLPNDICLLSEAARAERLQHLKMKKNYEGRLKYQKMYIMKLRKERQSEQMVNILSYLILV